MLTVRETTATLINDMEPLRPLGVPRDAVYQADTVDSPEEEIFIVIRWLVAEPGMGAVTRRRFQIWVYGPKGDYTIIDKIGWQIVSMLLSVDQTPVEGGLISQFEGGYRGPDMIDKGYDKAVISYETSVRASGI
jgi:hypothetical protein